MVNREGTPVAVSFGPRTQKQAERKIKTTSIFHYAAEGGGQTVATGNGVPANTSSINPLPPDVNPPSLPEHVKTEAGSTVFVEEIRTGRKKLAGQTIYKIAGTTDASSIKKIPGLTSENGSDMIRIVDVKNELVNRKTSLLKQNTASPAFASTYRNPNIAQSGGDVNRESAEDTMFRESPEGSTRLLFQQTEKELLDDAASFDSWQDFMEFYESFGKPEDSIVPSGADEAWYRTAWELARKRKPLPYIRNRAFNQAVQ